MKNFATTTAHQHPLQNAASSAGVHGKALWLFCALLILHTATALATNNYEYGADEYVTIAKGISPNQQYAITAHGEGELGYGKFHIFLTNATTGKKVGPLEEIKEALDTGAGSYCAKWSADSQQVVIIYRVDRHEPLKVVSYRIAKGRAFRLKGPINATNEQTSYWQDQCSDDKPSEKTFGTPKAN